MDMVLKKSVVKNAAVFVVLAVFNIYQGFNALYVLSSALLFLLILAGDLWVLLPLKRRTVRLAGFVDDLAAGGRDLTKRIDVDGDDEVSRLAAGLNSFVSRLHNLIGRSMNTANQVASASGELSKFSTRMAAGATRQDDQVRQVAVATEELNSTVNEVAANAQKVAELAKGSVEIAERGRQTAVTGMEDLKRMTLSVEDSSRIIAELGERVASIGEIISLIEDIADQTNLLALNAAIEAASAGEMGRGFAVVADEVRKLAERTTRATKEIAEVIKSLQKGAEEAMGTMESASGESRKAQEFATEISRALDDIAGASRSVSDSINQIATAVEEQSSTTTEISGNIEAIAQVVEDTAKNVKKTSDAAVELSKLSNELLEEVGGFRMNLFGVVPLKNAVEMNRKFAPLVEYLGRRLGMDLIIKVGKDYPEAIEDLGTGRALISYQTPTTYIEGKHKYGVRLLGYFEQNGSPTYRSVIVVSRSSGIRSVAELRGKRFAFGSEKSTGSTLVPMAMLAEAGITLNDLSGHAFLGSHDSVASAVLKGEFDAGGMMESVVAEFAEKGLEVIKVSEPIPQFPICATRDLPPDLVGRIVEALLSIPDPSIPRAIDRGYTRFLRAEDSDFDGVRQMVKRLYGVQY